MNKSTLDLIDNYLHEELVDLTGAAADAMLAEEPPNPLVPPEQNRKRYQEQIQEFLLMRPESEAIARAYALILAEGKARLSSEDWDAVSMAQNSLSEKVEDFGRLIAASVEEDSEEPLGVVLGIPETAFSAYFHLAQSLLEDDRLTDAYDIFLLLTFLDTENALYWFSRGIVARDLERVQEASVAFSMATMLKYDWASPRLEVMACYLTGGDVQSASEELDEFKELGLGEGLSENEQLLLASIQEELSKDDDEEEE